MGHVERVLDIACIVGELEALVGGSAEPCDKVSGLVLA
jgi:hypothetical protein